MWGTVDFPAMELIGYAGCKAKNTYGIINVIQLLNQQ